MNHLTATNSNGLGISKFNMSSFFYIDSFLFKKLIMGERTIAALDTFFAILLIILFAPAMILVSLAIKFTMGGNVFYLQTRVGKNGKHFRIIKFRSMVLNAEEKSGPMFSCKDDSRVTGLGKFLRASHLDELPQLFNVLAGEMSFVGPRPERPEFVEIFEKENSEYNRRSRVKPGITGLAQICLPYDAKAHEKLEYDLFYIENQESVLFHLMITYYTTLKMLTFHKNR